MNKPQLLENLKKDVYCRIGVSRIQGVGVIAVRDIPMGVNPFKGSRDYKLIPFKKEELEKLNPEVLRMANDFFAQEGDSLLIPECGLNSIDVSFFMNHSKNPNVKVGADQDFYTMREIKKGEELITDYSTFSDL